MGAQEDLMVQLTYNDGLNEAFGERKNLFTLQIDLII